MAARIYVDRDATGANDGSSWVNAYNYLQDALAAASSGDEIRVARGVYKPDQGAGVTAGERTATFQLISGVAIYGGIGGGESILSGDIGTAGDSSDNSYHVVTGSGTDVTAVLDGFTITAGNFNSSGAGANYHGGGMCNDSGSPTVTNCTFTGNSADYGGGMGNFDNSNPTVKNCTFTGNLADHGGGMLNFSGSNPTLTNCTFSGNSADVFGGGMCNFSGSSLTVTNCAFSGNSADLGGGMSNEHGSLSVTNCTFTSNSAASYGGGVYNSQSDATMTNCTFSGNSATYGGGMHNSYHSEPTVTNCTFSGNTAVMAGGMRNVTYSSPNIINCTFSGNSADSCGGVYNVYYSSPTLTNCILWGNMGPRGLQICNDTSTPSVTYCDVQGGYSGTGNINADPLFVNPDAGDFHLQAGSPCIDAGTNEAPGLPETDLDGNQRIIGDEVDMGAYEFQGIIGDFCGANSDQPDGYVDYWDLLYFAQRWHTRPGDTNWDPRCDLAQADNYVDYWDLLVFAQQWHKGEPP